MMVSMKKHVILLFAVSNIVFAQTPPKPPSDAEQRQKIIGSWHRVGQVGASKTAPGLGIDSTYTFALGGTFQKKIKVVVNKQEKQTTTMGTWQIQDNVLITTITNFPPERKIRPEAATSRQTIVKLTPAELSLQSKSEAPDEFKRIK